MLLEVVLERTPYNFVAWLHLGAVNDVQQAAPTFEALDQTISAAADKPMNDIRNTQEDEANLFAMALLMPEEWVRKEVSDLGGIDLCDDRKTILLSRKFGVPSTMMGIRLGMIYKTWTGHR